jgi:hypothetical protein
MGCAVYVHGWPCTALTIDWAGLGWAGLGLGRACAGLGTGWFWHEQEWLNECAEICTVWAGPGIV